VTNKTVKHFETKLKSGSCV